MEESRTVRKKRGEDPGKGASRENHREKTKTPTTEERKIQRELKKKGKRKRKGEAIKTSLGEKKKGNELPPLKAQSGLQAHRRPFS